MRRLVVTVLILVALISLAPGVSGLGSSALAQVGAPPGTPAAPVSPLPAPAGAPVATSTTGALPQLAPAPGVVQAAPQASPQVFRCSCFGNGIGTQWIGTVQASSYTLADQSAQSQCLAFHLDRNPGSPYIPPSASSATKSPYPTVNPNAPPGTVINPYAGGLTAPPGTFLPANVQRFSLNAFCSRCACN